jgi:hypothetical protein
MRYLIGLVVFILLVIFVIIKLLSGGSSDKTELPPSLASYANTSTTVRYTIDNPTQASETHRDIIIEVGSNVATLTVTKGYEGEIVRTQSYNMNSNAYADFLLALDRSGGYTLGNTDKKVADERGYCATGNRYIYEIIDGSGNKVQHLWSTSCKEKTFKGLPKVVNELFEKQIPNFGDLVDDVDY